MKYVILALYPLLMMLSDCFGMAHMPPTEEQFLIRIDSIAHPASIRYDDSLTILLYGTIGADSCTVFSHIDETKKPLDVELTVWGKHYLDSTCATRMIALNGRQYKTLTNMTGWFKIHIRQPDGTMLTDSLFSHGY